MISGEAANMIQEYDIIGGSTDSFGDVLGGITAKATVSNVEGLVTIANQYNTHPELEW